MKNCDSYEKTDYLQITSTLSKWTPAIMDLIRGDLKVLNYLKLKTILNFNFRKISTNSRSN